MDDAAHADDAGLKDRVTGAAAAVRDAYEAMPWMLVSLAGPEHRVVAANAAYRAFVGRSDIIGRSPRDFLPEVAGQQLLEILDGVYTSAEPVVASEWRLHLDPGRTGVLDEHFIDFDAYPRFDSTGTVIGISVRAEDVTERVRERQAAQARLTEAARRHQAAREVVEDLQKALLPASLPVLPGVTLAARYLVAAEDQAAGGDWFDAIPRPDGTVALVVGDVVGHGIQASAAMGQLRAVLAALLYDEPDIGIVLRRVDALATRNPAMRATTLCMAVLDPATGSVRYCTAGHPPPLLIEADGGTRYLAPSRAGPLGTGSPPELATAELPVESVLLLYSDGLVERPGRPLNAGMATLAEVAGDAVAGRGYAVTTGESVAERTCRLAVELLTRPGYQDDVTTLAAGRRRTPVSAFHDEIANDPAEVSALRGRFRRWLADLGSDEDDLMTLELALSETVANSVEHAYPTAEAGRVMVDASLDVDGRVQLCVRDEGRWRTGGSPAATRGRGLWIVGALVEELHIDRPQEPGHGTLVRAYHRLHHLAHLASDVTGTSSERPADQYQATTVDGPQPTVEVSGPVDISTARLLGETLQQASHGGVRPITVDLSNTTILGSAGVRVLHELRDRLAVHGHPLALIAPAGSPAAAVLELVGLDHAERGAPVDAIQ